MTAVPARPPIPRPIVSGRLIAIARGVDPVSLLGIAEALATAGVAAFEVTLNSDGAFDGISSLRRHFPEDRLLVGAGTVLDVPSAARAMDAGASFIVTPIADQEIIRWAAERALPSFPGALTPSEIAACWAAGASAVKLFPASAVGPSFVRECRGPFPAIPLIPTGGVTLEGAAEYLRAGAVAVGLGGGLIGDGTSSGVLARARRLVRSMEGVPPSLHA